MKTSVLVRRLLCLLLVLLMLPLPAARAESDGRLVTVNTVSLFEDQFRLTQLLATDQRYYISLPEAAALAGLQFEWYRGTPWFEGEFVSVPISLQGIPSLSYEGEDYYALEPVMKQLQVYVFARDGMLVFNSVQYNLDRFLSVLHNTVLCGNFDADYLRDMPGLGTVAYYAAKAYQDIQGLHFNVYENYKDDISEVLVELVSPIEGDGPFNPFTTIQDVNKKLNKAAKYILKAEEYYEDAREFLYEIPAGGDILLFGIEGTRYLRESLEAVDGVNKLNVSDILLKTFLSYSEMSDYCEAVKDMDLKVSANVDMFSLSDLVTMYSYYVDVTGADGMYIRALDKVLRKNGMALGDLSDLVDLDTYRRDIILDQASSLVADYRNYINSNLVGFFASSTARSLEKMLSNSVEDILIYMDPLDAIGVKLGTTIFTKWLDWRFQTHTVAEMNAVTRMYHFAQIQSLFYDCMVKGLEQPRLEDVDLYRSAGLLYLKCAWHAIDGYSYSNLASSGVPVERMESVIEQAAADLMAYPSFCFTVVEPASIAPGSLTERSAGAYSLSDPALSPYLSISYADDCSFTADMWSEQIDCHYELPLLNDSLYCAPEVNRQIVSSFRNYVSGENGSYLIQGGEALYMFRDPLDTDAYIEDTSSQEDPRILYDLHWEASVWQDILSLRITRLYFNPYSAGFLFDDEYDVFNVDLTTGKQLSSSQVLERLGLDEAQVEERVNDKLREMVWPGGSDEQQTTLHYNPFREILERGFFLSPGGMTVWVYVDTGSRYLYKQQLSLDYFQDLGVWFGNPGSLPGTNVIPGGSSSQGRSVKVGTDACYFLVPDSWAGHFYIEIYDPYTFSIMNTDNRDAGHSGHLVDVVISTEYQSPQQLVDSMLEISEEVAAHTYYFGDWSGGIIYGAASPYPMYNYNLDDPYLCEIYESMLQDLSNFRYWLVLDESKLP